MSGGVSGVNLVGALATAITNAFESIPVGGVARSGAGASSGAWIDAVWPALAERLGDTKSLARHAAVKAAVAVVLVASSAPALRASCHSRHPTASPLA
jgi:hypothetical protein